MKRRNVSILTVQSETDIIVAQVRTLSLIIVTFTYLLVGAAIFDALEGPNNEKVKEGLVQLRENLKMKYKMNEDDYKMIEVLIEEKKPHKTGPQWKFAGSLYYAFVTLALIGYGHSTPSTMLGKVFTMAYSVVGIPLALIMFQVHVTLLQVISLLNINPFSSCRA